LEKRRMLAGSESQNDITGITTRSTAPMADVRECPYLSFLHRSYSVI
jgi:hypothetical protein